MSKKTILIIVVVAIAAIIIFALWSRAKNRRLQEQMERDRQQQQQSGGVSQFGTTIGNVGSLVDSLSGLFSQIGIGSGSGRNRPGTAEQQAASTDPSVAHQVECDKMWPNPSQQAEYENCLNCYPQLC